MSATEYFQRNCWISTECDDRFVADVIRWMGDDHIVFETDFPHPDSKYPHATEHFLALAPDLVSDDEQAQDPLGQRRRPLPVPRGLPAELLRGPAGAAEPATPVSDIRSRARRSTTTRSSRRTRRRPSTSRPRGSPTPTRSSARSCSGSGARAEAAADACRSSPARWARRRVRPARSATLDDLWRARPTPSTTSARASTPTRRGATTRASRPADALREPMRVFMSGGTTGKSRPTFYTQWDREVGARAHRPGAVHAGHPPRRRRAQLVGVRHPQRRVRASTRRCTTGSTASCSPPAPATSPAARRRSSSPSSTGPPRSSPPATTCCASPTWPAKMGYDPADRLQAHGAAEHRRPRRCSSRRSASSASTRTASTRCSGCRSSARRTTGLHIFEDAFIVQIVDPETGEPLPDGELGSICITELYKTGSPQFRYNIMDLSYLYPRGQCACGSWLRQDGAVRRPGRQHGEAARRQRVARGASARSPARSTAWTPTTSCGSTARTTATS